MPDNRFQAKGIYGDSPAMPEVNPETGAPWLANYNFPRPGATDVPRPGAAGVTDGGPKGTSAYIDKKRQLNEAFTDANGRVHVYEAEGTSGEKELIFVQGADGEWRLDVKPGSGGDSLTAGESARLGLDWARLNQEVAENEKDRAFKAGESDKDRAARADEFNRDQEEGRRQFDAKFGRENFDSDRKYQFERERFAAEQAEATAAGKRDDVRLGLEGQRVGIERGRADTERQSAATRFGLEAEQLAASQAQADREAAMQEEAARREVLRNPSDWLYRAYASRGEQSPHGRVTQQDLMDTIGRDGDAARQAGAAAVAAARAAASRFGQSAPVDWSRFMVPGAGVAQTPQVAPTGQPSRFDNTPGWTPTPGGGTGAMPNAAIDLNANEILANTAAGRPNGGWQPTPSNGVPLYEHGGMQAGPQEQPTMAIVGDSSSGKENEELVIDLPNDGGLMVIPKDRLVGKRKVSKNRLSGVPKMENGGIVNNGPIDVGHGMANQTGSLPGGGDYYKNQDGTSGFNATTDLGKYHGYLNTTTMTQQQAQQASGYTPQTAPMGADMGTPASRFMLNRMAPPPAVRDVLAGQNPNAYRFANANLTPQKLARLTEGEMAALQTELASDAQGGASLADEIGQLTSLFGGVVGRSRFGGGGGGRF